MKWGENHHFKFHPIFLYLSSLAFNLSSCFIIHRISRYSWREKWTTQLKHNHDQTLHDYVTLYALCVKSVRKMLMPCMRIFKMELTEGRSWLFDSLNTRSKIRTAEWKTVRKWKDHRGRRVNGVVNASSTTVRCFQPVHQRINMWERWYWNSEVEAKFEAETMEWGRRRRIMIPTQNSHFLDVPLSLSIFRSLFSSTFQE